MKRTSLVVFLAALSLAPHLLAQEPGQERGFAADKVFDFRSGIDTVNTFNGNLSLRLPLGPAYPVNGSLSYSLQLVYNAKVWDYEHFVAGQYTRALANRRSNSGVGWLLSLGRLITPWNGTNDSGGWRYESPDGADHLFWSTLHDGDPATALAGNVKDVGYTRDGSYLRMLQRDFNNDNTIDSIDVEFPGGLVRTFHPVTGNLNTISDRFGNFVSITYPPSVSGTPCPATDNFAWRITDSQSARTNYVCFKEQPYFDSTYDGQVERVILAAPPDPDTGAERTTTFVFNYLLRDIARGCFSDYPNDNPLVEDVPMLFSVVQNPNTDESITYNFSYNESHAQACESGALAFYTLPTGATVYYTYRFWWLPVEGCTGNWPWLKQYTGIHTRNITGPRIPSATWTYTSVESSSRATGICADDEILLRKFIPSEQVTTTVTDPLGNVTEHFYSAWPGNVELMRDENGNPIPNTGMSPNGFRKNEYGLPFTRMPGTGSGGKFLSQRIYTPTGYAANPKQPLRSTHVTYERDNTSCAQLDDACLHANERITSERVVYHDDDGRIADSEYTSYDGLGNLRQASLSGTFASGNVVHYTAFNERHADVNPAPGSGTDGFIDSGTYPATFRMPTLAHAWILNLASFVQTTQAGTTATTQACYDPATGILRASRVLKGTSRAGGDLLATFTADAAGNLATEAFAGGDVTANAPTTGTLCTTASTPPTADYTINHTHGWGMTKTSQHAGASFFSRNHTIHKATGIVLGATDSAGHTTTFKFDRAFRLKNVSPPGVAGTSYVYTLASGSGATAVPARVEEKATSAGGLGSIETHYQYDALGRAWRRKSKMPDGSWSVSETRYNAIGWPEWTSKRETLVIPAPTQANPNPTEYDFVPNFKTTYTGYDPFGRAASVTAPDGHANTFQYRGASSVRRTVTIATRLTEETAATTDETFDRQQRLISVTEAYGTPEAVTTSYTYDVGGRLASVSMPSAAGTQTRTFKYDHRGILEYEEHPELGGNGYGRTTYGPYDARGHARRKITGTTNGAFDLSFTFDEAERIAAITQTATSRTISLFDYDDPTGALYGQCSNNRCNGKLAASARYNYFDGDLGTIPVTESYQYDGPGGAITRRDHAIGSTASFAGEDFAVLQAHNDLGKIESTTYPCRKNDDGTCTAASRTVNYGYTNGFLTSVTDFATSISYHANGLPGTVIHANGVADTLTANVYGMVRPCSMLAYRGTLVTNSADPCGVSASQDATLSWSTGEYQYDGAGNVKKIGDTKYIYDPSSRLRGWTRSGTGGSYSSHSLAFDTYGNYLFETLQGCGPLVNGRANCYTTSVLARRLVGTTNHYSDTTYDDAGNVTADYQRQMTYDPMNRTRTVTASDRHFRYLYGPDEERIAVVERVTTGGGLRNRTTWTLRGFDHELLSAWTDDSTSGTRVWAWKEDEIWRGGAILASVQPTRTLHYSLDHLGSPRVVTDAAGQLLGQQEFSPFGGGGTSDGGFLQFTGQERDAAMVGGSVAKLPDYFHARMYDWQGRFLSVDPLVGHTREPQSWNRYVYAQNNPLKHTDPTGMYIVQCDAADKNCKSNAAAFENARQMNLNNPWGDEELKDTAEAYGDLGVDNGIVVTFSDPGKGAAGSTGAWTEGKMDGTMTMKAVVKIQPGLRGTELRSAVAHEGMHLVTANAFVATFTQNAGWWDIAKNLREYDAEMRAFKMTQRVLHLANGNWSSNCADCTLQKSMAPLEVEATIRRILANPNGIYKVTPENPGKRQLSEWPDAPGKSQ